MAQLRDPLVYFANTVQYAVDGYAWGSLEG